MAETKNMIVRKDSSIFEINDPVKRYLLIEEGSVIQRIGMWEQKLTQGSLIGLSEQDRSICDYIAAENCVLIPIPLPLPEGLAEYFNGQQNRRSNLLGTSMSQRQKLLEVYKQYENIVFRFHNFVEDSYQEYTSICSHLGLPAHPFQRMEHFQAIEMWHRAEEWEEEYSQELMAYQLPYLTLMKQYDSLTVGAIMEISHQCHRITQGISEMVEYLQLNKNILMNESRDDIFNLYQDVITRAENKNIDVSDLLETVDENVAFIHGMHLIDEELVSERLEDYKSRSLSSVLSLDEKEVTRICHLNVILEYADLDSEKEDAIRQHLEEYRGYSDLLAATDDLRKLRKQLTKDFYLLYETIFMKAILDRQLSTSVLMFLNFGFLDDELVDEETTAVLVALTQHLEMCNYKNIMTAFSWLRSIFLGMNEPSKNELDLDYTGHLNEMRKNGDIQADEVANLSKDNNLKLHYELENMFPSGNRATHGHLSTYCPILISSDLINSPDKMLVTAAKLDQAMDAIKAVDFSCFYRETTFSDPEHGINAEMIQTEILPQIILMPNAGTRPMMWQETAGVRRDTPARFLFPILTAMDLDDMMMETMARYRWEICRKIQGVHWNDITDKSLTSMYCDYLQFYRKNHDLSQEAKDKVKNMLVRSRNNYREVFVRDYMIWIKFESRGSFRLNRVSRDILLSFCPFAKSLRDPLTDNPMYSEGIHKYNVQISRTVKRLNGLYKKYEEAGGEITEELQDNLAFYEM